MLYRYGYDAARPPLQTTAAGMLQDGRSVWWRNVEASTSLEEVGLNESKPPTVQAVTLAPEPTSDFLGTSIVFSKHLAERRSQRGLDQSCVVSALTPTPPAGYVRLPHLITYKGTSITEVQDAVIWEVIEHQNAISWLGAELPDHQSIEQQLPTLLYLRRAVRQNIPSSNRSYIELQRRLAAGRYMSILFVYQNVELFQRLFEDFGEVN